MKNAVTLVLSVLLLFVLAHSFVLAGTVLFMEDINKDGVKETAYMANISSGSGGTFYDLLIKKGQIEVFSYPLNTVGSGYIVKDVTNEYPGKEIVVWTDQRFKDKYATNGQFVFYWFGWNKQVKRYSLYGWQITNKNYPINDGKTAFQEFSDQSGTKNNFYKAMQLSDKLFQAVKKNDWETVKKLVTFPDGDIETLDLTTIKKHKSKFSLPLVVPSHVLYDGVLDTDKRMNILYYKVSGNKYYDSEHEVMLLYPDTKTGKIMGTIR